MFFKTSAFYFFYFSSVGIQVIFLADILKNIGYSPYLVGIVFAMPGIMKFVLPFLFIRMRITKFQLYFYQVLFILASTSLYFTIENFYLLLISISVIAFCSGVLLPLVDSISMQVFGSGRYGKTRLWGSIGFILIGLFLGEVLSGYFLALHCYLLCTIMIVLFSYLCIDDEHLVLPKYDFNSKITSRINQNNFWISIFLLQVSFGAMYGFFTIYERSFGVSLSTISYFWTVAVVCTTIFPSSCNCFISLLIVTLLSPVFEESLL